MTITEPMTLATDYLIVAVALSLSWKLFKSWREDRIEGKRLWALALLFTGCGAFFGGTYHGFKARVPRIIEIDCRNRLTTDDKSDLEGVSLKTREEPCQFNTARDNCLY